MDQNAATQYSVILRLDSKSVGWEMLEQLASKVKNADGTNLLHFWCSHVDASHPIYLEIVSHKPTTAPGLRLRVPHHSVLLIADPEIAKQSIGFLPAT